MPESREEARTDQNAGGASGPTVRTKVGRKWLVKTLIFLVVLVGFGLWGLWDATVVYPDRGIAYAENAKRLYLRAARDAGMLFSARVPDPVEAFARVGEPKALAASRAAASNPNSPNQARALMDERLYEWLNGLDTVGRLKPEYTVMAEGPGLAESPDKELERLEGIWSKKDQPKPLAKWDLPVQWLFVVVGLGGGLALAILMLRVVMRSYGWEPVEQRLYLPDGSSLVPGDIAEFDKRKWDKFLIFLKVKPDRGPHSGREVRLDLLRYTPLEEWVLAMERTAFPEHAQREAAKIPAAEEAPQAS